MHTCMKACMHNERGRGKESGGGGRRGSRGEKPRGGRETERHEGRENLKIWKWVLFICLSSSMAR